VWGALSSIDGVKRWLAVAAVVWALVLGVTAYVAARSGPPTAREQTTLAQARDRVDQALAAVATAAGPDSVAALSAYTLDRGCRITTAREGTDLSRVIRLYTSAGGERALLDRLAAALPAGFRARVPRPVGSAAPALRADAGDFVALRGTATGPGEVRVAAEAGCRTGSDLGTPALSASSAAAERAPVESVLRALDAPSPQWHAYQVPCPGGGAVRTVEADSATTASPGPLPAALAAVAGGAVAVLSQPQRYAYRVGATAIAVRVQDGAVTVTATTSCS
jgi:hypothetical protein